MHQLARNFVILVVLVMALCCIKLCQLPGCGAEGDKASMSCELEDRSTDSRPAQSDRYSKSLRGYKCDLDHRIKRCWFPPKDGKPAVVRFNLSRKGEASNLVLLMSSGERFSDEAALNAVKLAQPFKAIPKELPAPLEAEFNFRLYSNSGQKPPGLTLRAPVVKY